MNNQSSPVYKTVMIVDDDPLLRMTAADFLTDQGFEVVEAASGEEAVALLGDRDDIFMVFSDVQMSGAMDGVGLATIVAYKWPQVRVLLTSGSPTPSAKPLPRQVIFLAKPYNLSAIARVASAL